MTIYFNYHQLIRFPWAVVEVMRPGVYRWCSQRVSEGEGWSEEIRKLGKSYDGCWLSGSVHGLVESRGWWSRVVRHHHHTLGDHTDTSLGQH